MNNEILFLLAKEFISMSLFQKFTIGVELKAIDPQEWELPEPEIEERVFTHVVRCKKIPELTEKMHRILYE